MSVEDIGRIRKPIIWTLHDMWPFSGVEHYGDDGPLARWRSGYSQDGRQDGAFDFDLDQWVWSRKRKAWRRPMHIVCPSRWLAECARASALMGDWPVHVVPNPLDTEVFKPLNREFARDALNLSKDRVVLLFGAIRAGEDPRKGADLLFEALRHVYPLIMMSNPICIVFGQAAPALPPNLPLEVRWMGNISDDLSAVLLYSAADVLILPSRQENLPQTGTEAEACGCPVVAFDVTGLSDVVEHQVTGYLATPYSPEHLASGIAWVVEDASRRQRLSQAARARAVRLWNQTTVCKQYLDVYQEAVAAT